MSSLLATAALVVSTALMRPSVRFQSRPIDSARSRLVVAEDVAEPYRPPPLEESALAVGQIVPCTVLGKCPAGYQVDIGAARSALVPRSHVTLRPNMTVGKGHGWGELPVGAVYEAQVLKVGERGVNVSLARAMQKVAWQRVRVLAAEDVTIKARILRYGDNGVKLDVEGLAAFLPWSHWALPVEERVPSLINTKLAVKILDADRLRSRLLVSHRRVLLEEAMANLNLGEVVEGVVSSVKSFGGVIALPGGIEGLLHISQISQVYVRDVNDVLTPGDRIRCVVENMDTVDGSVRLSTKRLESRPGEMLKNASVVYERAGLSREDVDLDGGGDGTRVAEEAAKRALSSADA